MNNLKDIIFIIALAVISVVDSFATCTYSSSGWTVFSNSNPQVCKLDASWGGNMPVCASLDGCSGVALQSGNYGYYDCWINYSGRNACLGQSNTTAYTDENNTRCHYRCSTKSEADSIVCTNNGKIWDVDPVSGVGSCVEEVSCNWTVSTIPRTLIIFTNYLTACRYVKTA